MRARRSSTGGETGVWVGPTTEGGRCVVLRVAADGATVAPSNVANSGGWCERPPLRAQSAPIATTVNWLRPDGSRFDVVLAGQVAPASGIVHLELRSAA